MSELTYRISSEVLSQFPGYRLAVLVFADLDNHGKHDETTALLREAEAAARGQVNGAVTDEPVVAAWRDAYRNFGARPSEHRSSIEALLRRATRPDTLPTINSLVDIGNIVSLKHLIPAGVHPLRHQSTEIELRLARSGDRFFASGEQPEDVTPGEVVLADQFEILTRRWTWRQSLNTRMQVATTQAFFNLDALEVSADDQLAAAIAEVKLLVERLCGGRLVHEWQLSAGNAEFSCSFD
jgi:DNA/RNA-binding domain of Phe-tRNA-synthetase-like protein